LTRRVAPRQATALELYHSAVKQGHFRAPRVNGPGDGSGTGSPTANSPAAFAPGGPGGPSGPGGPGAGAPLGGAGGGRGELNLHALTAGVAMISLYLWLCDLRDVVTARGDGALPAALAIVTDAGSNSKEQVGPRGAAPRPLGSEARLCPQLLSCRGCGAWR
jgi:hypothetical protein